MKPEKQRFDITSREAASRLGVTRQTVKNMIDAGRLKGNKVFDAASNVETWMVDSQEVEEVVRQKNSRTVAGYSEAAMQQYRDTFGGYFQSLEEAIKENTEIGRQRLEAGRKAAEQRDREYEQRAKMNELLERVIEQNEQSGATLEEISDKKDEGLAEIKGEGEQKPEQKSWWKFWG